MFFTLKYIDYIRDGTFLENDLNCSVLDTFQGMYVRVIHFKKHLR